MTRRRAALGEHRQAILDVAAAHKATSVSLVGSVARGDDTPDSDTDFLVTFAAGTSLFDIAGLIAALEDLLNGPVDVIPRDCLEPETRQDHRAMLADEVPL